MSEAGVLDAGEGEKPVTRAKGHIAKSGQAGQDSRSHAWRPCRRHGGILTGAQHGKTLFLPVQERGIEREREEG